MRIEGFAAEADLVGHRIKVAWQFVPQGNETVADAPQVVVRRKLRDFDFPAPAAPDPFLVYDSVGFPPAPGPGLTVTDLPGWEERDGPNRVAVAVISVARSLGGRFVEVMRRTVSTTFGPTGAPLGQRVELLDHGGLPGALEAGEIYYYELTPGVPLDDGNAPYRHSAAATAAHALNRKMYEMLPELMRRHDVVARPTTAGSDSVPEAMTRGGQLRRFIDLFGLALDHLRSSAESLRRLSDIDGTDWRYLPFLAAGIGWDLSVEAGVPLQRNEIKWASRAYRTIGTPVGLRAVISQYTGWFTRVAELAQHIARANLPAQLNVFALAEDGGAWRGPDDAAPVLGFGPGNEHAVGAGLASAVLTGTAVEPFALRPGMALELAIDGELPVAVRFDAADFADVGQATADEVAAAVERNLREVTARGAAGRVEVRSKSAGTPSSLHIERAATSLVSLEGAPGGRLSGLIDSTGRQRVFFEADEEAQTGPARRILYKTFADGAWRDHRRRRAADGAPQGSPAAVALPGDALWLAWLDRPHTNASRIRFARAAAREALPARLIGRRRGPFALVPGTSLRLTGSSPAETFAVQAADYADPALASAAEVAAAVNAQLASVSALVQPNGSIRLETAARGSAARLRIDLAGSTAARALGFGPDNAAAAGDWDDELEWEEPEGAPFPPGRHADLSAVADPAGGVRLFWSRHAGAGWRVTAARWDATSWVATAGGASARGAGGAWTTLTTADGLPSNDVRAIATDADGFVWMATAAGAFLRRPDGSGATFTTLDGLSDDDVRAVALAPDGAAWFATAAGVSVRRADGTWTSFPGGGGPPDDDVRAVAVAADGTVWAATAAGAAARAPTGAWRAVTSPPLAATDLRDVAVGAGGAVWLAGAAGLALLRADGSADVFDAADGLPSGDLRAVAVGPDGRVAVASSAGAALGGAGGGFRAVPGLPSSDARGVLFAPDGALWVATAAGVAAIGPAGVTVFEASTGLGASDSRRVHGPWSAPRELAASPGGDREPFAAVDGAQRTWLFWSERQAASGIEDTWLLRWRRHDPAAMSWSPAAPLTSVAAPDRASDREPAAALVAGGLRVFFRSDRDGRTGLWSADLSSAGVASAPVALPGGEAHDGAPMPMAGPGGARWLLFRSDRSLSLAQVAAGPVAPPTAGRPAREHLSTRVPDAGALRRHAGATTPIAGQLARARLRRQWGDLLAYTPQKPLGAAEPPLTDDELYTRGTIALYLSRGSRGNPLTREEALRLRQIVARFLPINVRAVLVLAPGGVVEDLYPAGADIGESYADKHPFIEVVPAASDAAAAALPGWLQLLSTTIGHVSVDPGDTTTLRRRTWFRPPE